MKRAQTKFRPKLRAEISLVIPLVLMLSYSRTHQLLPLSGLFSAASAADGDPGLFFGCGHQLGSDLRHLSLQLVKLQPPHQRADKNCSYGVGEPKRRPNSCDG